MPTLTAKEKADGWKLLFDGKSLAGWRAYQSEAAPAGWRAVNGELVFDGKGGDLMTADQYGDFEMRFDWKVTPNGNSGVIYRIATTEPQPWHTGPEFQILHNAGHKDGGESPHVSRVELRGQSAGEGCHEAGRRMERGAA